MKKTGIQKMCVCRLANEMITIDEIKTHLFEDREKNVGDEETHT